MGRPVPAAKAQRRPQNRRKNCLRSEAPAWGGTGTTGTTCWAQAPRPVWALTLGHQELLEGLDALGGLLPSVFIGRRPLIEKAAS